MGLSLAATLFGLGWLVLILGELLWQGFSGTFARRLHRDDAAAWRRWRSAQSDRRQPDPDGARGAHRHAGRHAGRHLYGGIRPLRPAQLRGALHQRHPAQRALDRGRPVHLRVDGGPDGSFFRICRRGRARGAGHAGGGPHHRGHADAGAEPACARPRSRSARRVPSLSRGCATAPRKSGMSPASCWRSPASPARPLRSCSRRSTTSSGAPTSTRRWRACRSSSSSSRSRPTRIGRSSPGPAR